MPAHDDLLRLAEDRSPGSYDRFLRACSPERIRALVEENRRLREALAPFTATVPGHGGMPHE